MISNATKRLNRSPVRSDADTPVASTRYTGWKPTWFRSAPGSPIAYTSTASSMIEPTTSMIVASRSATNVMPTGAGQPPACATIGPLRSTSTSKTTETTHEREQDRHADDPLGRAASGRRGSRARRPRAARRSGQERASSRRRFLVLDVLVGGACRRARPARSPTSSSTSSSRVSSQLRYASASRNVVTANVMTIAVSANACGSGSLRVDDPPSPRIGGSPRCPEVIRRMLAPCVSSPRPMMIRLSLRCRTR